MGWKSFNDRLALAILVVIPLLWVINGKWGINLSQEVVGALLMTWGLIIQYYFRRAPPSEPPNP